MTEISGNQAEIAKILGISVSEAENLSPEQSKALQEYLFLSSISPSEMVPQIALFIASNPSLYPPSLVNAAIKELSVNNAEAINNLLDQWNESLDNQAEELKEKHDEQIKVNAQRQHELNAEAIESQAISRAEFERQVEMIDVQRAWIQGTKEYVQAEKESVPDGALMVASLAIGVGLAGQFMNVVDVISTDGLTAHPLQDSLSHIAKTEIVSQPLLASSMPAINLFVTGLVYQTAASLVGGSLQTKTAPTNHDFAQKYAMNVLNLIRHGGVNFGVRALVLNQLSQGKKISSDRVDQLVSIAKLMMLSQALALLYKIDTGKLTDLEFAGMLNGTNKIVSTQHSEKEIAEMVKEGSLPANLAALGLIFQMHEELQKLDREERARMLEAIFNYMDSNPKVEELLDPLKSVKSMLGEVPQQAFAV